MNETNPGRQSLPPARPGDRQPKRAAAQKALACSRWSLKFAQDSKIFTDSSTETIGEYVRRRRKAAALTQRELGDLAGVGQRFVSELERNKPTVRVESVNKVLAVFGKQLGPIDAPREDGAP